MLLLTSIAGMGLNLHHKLVKIVWTCCMIDVEAPWILLNIDFVKAQNIS